MKSFSDLRENKITEAPEDDMPASPDEKSMALDQAKFLKYVGEEITEYLNKNKEFPEWMQNKLSGLHEKAKDMHAVMAGDYEDDEDDKMNEDISKMSHGRLKWHMNTGTPHGSYSKDELKKERDRRLKYRDSADAYKKAKPGLSEEAVDEAMTASQHRMAMIDKIKKSGVVKSGSMSKNEEKVDEALPPHLQKHFDKDGNALKGKWVGTGKNKKWVSTGGTKNFKVIDRTPKGYGPNEETVDEAAPKMKGDSFKQERERARQHDAAMGRTPTGRKKPVRQMTSTQRSLASLRGNK